MKMIDFDPQDHAYSNIYKLMIGSIVPRPIAFVSSVDAAGIRNLAPFSFFTGVGSNPPTVLFCPVIRTGDLPEKDTLRNVEATGEFVVNIVSESFAAQMNQCSAEVPADVDEFALSGLTAVASDLVRPPRVAESAVQMECKLMEIIRTGAQPGAGIVVLGRIVRFHIREDLVDNYRIDPDKLAAIGRMGGPTYARTHDRFDLQRPK